MTRDAYNQIEQVLERLMASSDPSVSLSVLASDLGLSEGYFQRLFTEWAGVSPKKFQQFLTLEAAKERLQASESVLDASLDAGLSGPGRLHDLMVSLEAMSPGEYKDGGAGLQIRFGELSTPFGMATIFRTYRGICALEFLSISHALEQVQ
jgi:AraC family transcriptional regulator of adaptative response/methylated-DNA-[protein]-cysteine methyltransferase